MKWRQFGTSYFRNVNSQSKFHSRKAVEITMRNKEKSDQEQTKKGEKYEGNRDKNSK